MAAWTHSESWTAAWYNNYRGMVQRRAPEYRGQSGRDCADLSTELLIRFASYYHLPLTFTDNGGVRYISKGERQTPEAGFFGRNCTWSSVAQYTEAVRSRLGTEALWNRNTVINRAGPQPGDLAIGFSASMHHTALVYQVYPAGTPHPRASDRSVPDFPGDEEAIRQNNQTEYFRSRTPNGNVHVDYLNYRSRRKDRAELIYYADATELSQAGFQYRMWSASVLDNWTDWNGRGDLA